MPPVRTLRRSGSSGAEDLHTRSFGSVPAIWRVAATALLAVGLFAPMTVSGVEAASAKQESVSTRLIIRGDRSVAGVQVLSHLARARAVLGAPDTTRRVSANECRAVWRSIGLTLGYLDLAGGNPCRVGGMVTATATSTAWRTNRGLRIGDRIRRLRLLYPRAKRVTTPPFGGWWLITRHTCPTTGAQAYPGLRARTSPSKVFALIVSVAACE
jgi:hypothetical protein